MISLWDVLTMFSGPAALGGAVAAARVAGGGTARVVLAFLLGVGMAAASIWVVRTRGARLFRYLERVPAAPRRVEFTLGLAYLLAGLWIPVSG
jgi:hypothetical protein